MLGKMKQSFKFSIVDYSMKVISGYPEAFSWLLKFKMMQFDLMF